jgi:hypothetical protein
MEKQGRECATKYNMVEPKINMCLGRGDTLHTGQWLENEIEEPLDITRAQQWLNNNLEIYRAPDLKVGDWEGMENFNKELAKYRVTLIAHSPQEVIAKELENPLDDIMDKFENRRFVAQVNYNPDTPPHRLQFAASPPGLPRADFVIEIYDWHTSDMKYRVVDDILDAVEEFIDYWREATEIS